MICILTHAHSDLKHFIFFIIYFLINLFIYYLFLAALGLRCCARAFSSCGEWGPLFIVVHGLLIVVASLVAEHRLQSRRLQQLWHMSSVAVARRLSSCGSWAQLLHGMWDLPRPGIEPLSPALAGEFLTTVPQGKPSDLKHFNIYQSVEHGPHLDLLSG